MTPEDKILNWTCQKKKPKKQLILANYIVLNTCQERTESEMTCVSVTVQEVLLPRH